MNEEMSINVFRTSLGEVIIAKVAEINEDGLILVDPAALVPQSAGLALVPLIMWQRPYSGARMFVKHSFIVAEFDDEQAANLIQDYRGASAGIAIAKPGGSR